MSQTRLLDPKPAPIKESAAPALLPTPPLFFHLFISARCVHKLPAQSLIECPLIAFFQVSTSHYGADKSQSAFRCGANKDINGGFIYLLDLFRTAYTPLSSRTDAWEEHKSLSDTQCGVTFASLLRLVLLQ